MEDHTFVKRLKSDTTIVYPNLSQRSCKTDLFKEIEFNSLCHQSTTHEPQIQDQHQVEFHQVDQETISDHQRRTLQDCKSWDNCREELISAHFQSQFPSNHETCATCNKAIEIENHIRCADCSLQTFFCTLKCLKENHNGRQMVFHKPEIWQVLHVSNLSWYITYKTGITHNLLGHYLLALRQRKQQIPVNLAWIGKNKIIDTKHTDLESIHVKYM